MQKTVSKVAVFLSLFLSSFLFFDFASAAFPERIQATIVNGNINFDMSSLNSYISGLGSNAVHGTTVWGVPKGNYTALVNGNDGIIQSRLLNSFSPTNWPYLSLTEHYYSPWTCWTYNIGTSSLWTSGKYAYSETGFTSGCSSGSNAHGNYSGYVSAYPTGIYSGMPVSSIVPLMASGNLGYEYQELGDTYVFFSYLDDSYNWVAHAYIPITISGSIDSPIYSITPSTPVDGVCGSSNQIESSQMPTTGLCTSGTAHTYPFSGLIWQWSCEGANGGTTENCFAYATGNQNVTPTCGSNNGQTFSSWSLVDINSSSYCSVGLQTNNAYTSNGQTWSCTTLGVATSVDCSFTVMPTTYPTLPSETDCSTYTIPDKWFCEMNNTLKSFFLPSKAKLDEFNQTMNALKNKAPFNYLSVAGTSMNTLSTNINTKDIQFTFMGNTGTVNLNDISALVSIIKIFSVIMISIAMFFWARIYITHFFK